jgi:FKBP-type peptidyl-prolyl cis-trans isomerase
MKNSFILLTAVMLSVTVMSCQPSGSGSDVELNTPADSAGYAIGLLVGENNKQQINNAPGGDNVNLEAMAAAFRTAALGEEAKISVEEADKIIRTYFEAEGKKQGQLNLEEGNAFLEQNLKQQDVKSTESGLQYVVMVEGKGPKPEAEDRVRVHYHGTLIDGTVFDSSVDRGEPAVFGVNQVIPGWTEALQLMTVGSKWKVFIPAELAYGERGAGGDIGPNSVLIFEVELLEIVEE